MATVQAIREQEKTWSSIFPSQQVTEQQSALFVKKLLAVAVSSITYLRTIFPEHAFGDRCLEDLHLKILKDDSACPGACQVIQWIKGCFDALDKKYLRMIVIGIYVNADDPDTVIESYTFKFSYNDKEIDIFRNGNRIASAHTEKDTKKATIRLLRTIILLNQTLKSLPDDVMMTMKLLYYDEVTPHDYEPPGFKETPNDFFKYIEEPLNIKVGEVSTLFHTVKLRIKTDGQQFELKNDEEQKSETEENRAKDVELKPVNSFQGKKKVIQSGAELIEETDKDLHSPPTLHGSGPQKIKVLEQDIQQKESGVEDMECVEIPNDEGQKATQGDIQVKCPCGNGEDEGLMILCGVCDAWQHAVCFGILDQEEAPEIHVCVECSKGADADSCTDSSLVNLNTVQLQATCLWRRALMACGDLNRMLPTTLARHLKVEMSIAQSLVKRLEKEGYIRSTLKGKRLGKIVNKKKLQAEGFQKYFSRKPVNSKVEGVGQVAVDDPTSNSTDRVDKITEQCSKMNVSGKPQQHKEDNKKRQSRKSKRVTSLQDKTAEFEISNSQESRCEDLPISKRRKASIARSPILV